MRSNATTFKLERIRTRGYATVKVVQRRGHRSALTTYDEVGHDTAFGEREVEERRLVAVVGIQIVEQRSHEHVFPARYSGIVVGIEVNLYLGGGGGTYYSGVTVGELGERLIVSCVRIHSIKILFYKYSIYYIYIYVIY